MNVKILTLLLLFIPTQLLAETSTCFGTTSNGYLVNGVQLPASGYNFVSYSKLARIAGRTYVHSAVKKIIVNAYKDLEAEKPEKVYKYAETGFKDGGQFKPHKTHRNGLSVDFMTPVIDSNGKSVHLPTHLFNKFGYDIEFNKDNLFDDLNIDYEALASHIVSLHKHAKKLGYDIWRVIFAPELQADLFKTNHADYLKKYLKFSTKRSWVRHDEHYHVDFSVPCEAL